MKSRTSNKSSSKNAPVLSPLTSLTDKELKTLSELCDAGIESGISPRFTKELTRIKGKLRRGF